MSEQNEMQLFEDQPIRTAWDAENEEWLFSVVDVVGVLTEQPDARHASTYWAVLKKRLADEGANQLLTNCKQLQTAKKCHCEPVTVSLAWQSVLWHRGTDCHTSLRTGSQ